MMWNAALAIFLIWTRFAFAASFLVVLSLSSVIKTFADTANLNSHVSQSVSLSPDFQLEASTRNLKNLSSGTIRSARDQDGFFWFLHKDGVYRYDGIELLLVLDRYGDSLGGSAIYDLLIDDHHLWLGGPHGLFRLNLGTYDVQAFSSDKNDTTSLGHNHITALTRDQKGRIWISHRQGLSLFQPGENNFRNYPFPEHLAKNTDSTSVQSVALDRTGLLWLSARENGVFLLDVEHGVFYPARNILNKYSEESFFSHLENPGKGSVFRDVSGNVMVALSSYLLEFSDINNLLVAHELRSVDGNDASAPRRFVNDQNGDLWAIHGPRNLIKLSRSANEISYGKVINASGDIGKSFLYGISIGDDGTMVLNYSELAPHFSHIEAIQIERVNFQSLIKGAKSQFNLLKVEDPHSWWLMSEAELVLYDHENSQAEVVFKASSNDSVLKQLMFDYSDGVWLRTYSGIYRFEENQGFKKIFSGRYYSMRATKNRQIFLQIDNGKVLQYDLITHKKTIHRLSGLGVSSILYMVNEGHYFIVVHKDGMLAFDDLAQSFVKVDVSSLDNDISLASIYAENGELWLSSGDLRRYRLDRMGSDFILSAVGSYQYHDGFTYGRIKAVTEDGVWVLDRDSSLLLNIDPETKKTNIIDVVNLMSVLKNISDLEFIGNNKIAILGAFTINIVESKYFDNLKSLYPQTLNSIHIFRNSSSKEFIFNPVNDVSFDDDVGLIEFHFSNNSINSGFKEGVKYRLKGLNDSWVSSSSGSASYGGLSPGKYQFQVLDFDNTLSVDYAFEIEPPFWGQVRVYSTVAAFLFFLVLFALHLWRSRSYIRRKAADMLRIYSHGFEQATNAFCVVNESMEIVIKNKIFDQLLKQEEAGGVKLFSELDLYADENKLDGKGYLEEIVEKGKWEGSLIYDYQNGNFIPFYCKAVEVIQELAKQRLFMFILEDSTQRYLYESELRHVVNTDALTDLPNRHYMASFVDAKVNSSAEGTAFALIYIDLDRFKNFNDSFNHGFGDRLLVAFVARLKSCLDGDYLLCRIGGDEFALLVSGRAAIDRCTLICKNIISSLQNPFTLKKRELYCSVSIGVVMYPHHGENLDILLQHADVAMSSVKKSGGNGYSVYHKSMLAEGERSMQIEGQLRKAIASGNLTIFYQPKIKLSTLQVTGYEALVRFTLPNGELAPTEEFINVAENTGLIIPVSRLVVALVCEQLCSWRNQNLEIKPIAINLSGCLFSRFDLLDELDNYLRSYDLPAPYIEFEVTENILMQDIDQTVNSLKALRERGHPISIDDFGTGYSSLSYLAQLPLNTIKIDKSFVHSVDRDFNQQSIIHAVVELASSFGLEVVAEGVESKRIHNYLHSMGCDYGQGYYYDRPMPAEKLNYGSWQA
ncbi:EAL domain-containing protein [uncultured Pseudoteredinibacter sp.]|uniref:EAL domain-containing protein n=1 Tax=uncultured Pseudoteredinibacter sp. TaxID=1641701 RepID=UPI00260F8FE9|nr:EAL domain-containing protein [uncultured Pseudoteredinibacter sp.]